jgi:uncharacterized membrane protein YeiH
MTDGLFLLFDAIGTIAFAMSGAFKAVRRNLDVLGVLVLGFATAMGGGIIRDALLQRSPAAFHSNLPALYSLAGCVVAAAWKIGLRHVKTPEDDRAFLFFDALGLAIFAVTGARLGYEAGLNTWSVAILAALTGVGGGVVRDILVCEIPMVLKADFYATAALIGGLVYVLAASFPLPAPWGPLSAFLVTLILRTLAIWRGWHLPRLPA